MPRRCLYRLCKQRRKLLRCAVSQRPRRAVFIVILLPAFHGAAGVGQGEKPIRIQALLPKPPVKAFGITVLHRLTRVNVAKEYSFAGAPGLPGTRNELRSVVTGDFFRQATLLRQPLQHTNDPQTGQAGIDLNGGTFPRILIDQRQRPEALSRGQSITHKVHGPVLMGTTSSPSRLDYRVESFELNPCLGGSELPIDGLARCITSLLPGFDLAS